MKSARSTALILFFACLAVLQSGAVPARAAARPARILLVTPTDGRKIDGQAVLFSWKAEETDSTFKPGFYEVQIWDKAKNFRRTVRVQAEDSTGYGQAWIHNPRQVFRKHGAYLWRVVALDGNGRQRISGTRRFVMPPPRIKPLMAGPGKGHSLRLEYNHWSDFDSYRRFTDPLYPKTHLKSYADIGIGFRQSWETAVPFTVQERLLLLSQIGMGAELTPRVRILQNTFLAVDPWVRGRQCWYSTSLKHYSGTISEIAAGTDVVVMPGGHLVLSGAWLPVNRIRYGLRGGGLRTLQGAGWEAGVTVTLPRSLLSVIRVAGVNVDFQRMPIGFVFGRVDDGLTDIRLDYRRFSIEYLF
ncbi:MAG: hypothetical protein QUS35_04095 [bacterium]|nr:hypothetical protein [bacterium]